jgi:hypothetical protein
MVERGDMIFDSIFDLIFDLDSTSIRPGFDQDSTRIRPGFDLDSTRIPFETVMCVATARGGDDDRNKKGKNTPTNNE